MAEMNPPDVPQGLVDAATFAFYGVVQTDGAKDFLSCVRIMLAAVLPLYEQQVCAELAAVRAEFADHLAAESADAAAGSYAGRAEEAEAERRARLLDGPPAEMIEQFRLNPAYAARKVLRLDDEAKWLRARHDGLVARAEQAEAALAEARAQLAKIGRIEDEWGVDCGVLGVLYTSRAEFGTAEKAIKVQRPLMHRLAGEWHEASLEYAAGGQGMPVPCDVDKLTAPEGERLSDEEFAEWTSAWKRDEKGGDGV